MTSFSKLREELVRRMSYQLSNKNGYNQAEFDKCKQQVDKIDKLTTSDYEAIKPKLIKMLDLI